MLGHGPEYESTDRISKLSQYMIHFLPFLLLGIFKWDENWILFSFLLFIDT